MVVTKCLSEEQTGKNLIRLLHYKQSDLGLHCLSMPFQHETSVQTFRTFTICYDAVCPDFLDASVRYFNNALYVMYKGHSCSSEWALIFDSQNSRKANIWSVKFQLRNLSL